MGTETQHDQLARDPFEGVTPERAWLRITNMEKPGRFQVILEVNGKHDHVIFDSINECDGLIGHHHNLSRLIKGRRAEK